MYARVRESTFDPEKLARGRDQVDEFWRIRSEQPGYQGALTVDAKDGQTFIITLWGSEEQAEAARGVLDPHAQRLMGPLMSRPGRILGGGQVSYNDLMQVSTAAAGR